MIIYLTRDNKKNQTIIAYVSEAFLKHANSVKNRGTARRRQRLSRLCRKSQTERENNSEDDAAGRAPAAHLYAHTTRRLRGPATPCGRPRRTEGFNLDPEKKSAGLLFFLYWFITTNTLYPLTMRDCPRRPSSRSGYKCALFLPATFRGIPPSRARSNNTYIYYYIFSHPRSSRGARVSSSSARPHSCFSKPLPTRVYFSRPSAFLRVVISLRKYC